MNIHENIKVLRLQKRLSQLDIAEALTISQGAYAQLENGKTEITLNRLEQLAKLFGMTVIELLQYGSGVENVKVDSEKVKELEREIKDLKKDLEIRDLKLVAIENIKETIFYNSMLAIIKELLNENIFIPICRNTLNNQLDMINVKYSKENFISEIYGLFCSISVGFQDLDDTYFEFNNINSIAPTNEMKEYCSFYYDTFKIVIDINTAKHLAIDYFKRDTNTFFDVRDGINSYWKILHRNKNDKYFFEIVNDKNNIKSE